MMDTPMTAAVKLHTRVMEVLGKTETPMTSLDVYDKPEIKEICTDSGKLSVLMSDMWRAKKLVRQPCKVPGTHIKYAYTMAPAAKVEVQKVLPTERRIGKTPELAAPYGGATTSKPQITVTEHRVVIELSTMKITIDV